MTPCIDQSSPAARRGTPGNRPRRPYPHGRRSAWIRRRQSLIARARRRLEAGWYDRDPVLRIAVDRLIDRIDTQLRAR